MLVEGLQPVTHLVSYVRVFDDLMNTKPQLHNLFAYRTARLCLVQVLFSAGTDNLHRALTSAESQLNGQD